MFQSPPSTQQTRLPSYRRQHPDTSPHDFPPNTSRLPSSHPSKQCRHADAALPAQYLRSSPAVSSLLPFFPPAHQSPNAEHQQPSPNGWLLLFWKCYKVSVFHLFSLLGDGRLSLSWVEDTYLLHAVAVAPGRCGV